jgi:protein-disulfide isomerase
MSARGPEHARQVAAQKLADQRAAQRRRTAILVSLVVVAVLAIAAVTGIALYRSQSTTPATSATPKGGTATGIVVGPAAAPVTLDVYLDFQCPACKQFEETSGPTLDRYVAAGTVKIVYHPVAFLDPYSSGARYSTRASAASACAADAGVFPAYVRALYANQPPEGGTGLTDDQLVELGRQAGATSADFATCVTSHRYEPWTARVTEAASKAGVNQTPTVLVDGKPVEVPTTANVVAAIEAAARRQPTPR